MFSSIYTVHNTEPSASKLPWQVNYLIGSAVIRGDLIGPQGSHAWACHRVTTQTDERKPKIITSVMMSWTSPPSCRTAIVTSITRSTAKQDIQPVAVSAFRIVEQPYGEMGLSGGELASWIFFVRAAVGCPGRPSLCPVACLRLETRWKRCRNSQKACSRTGAVPFNTVILQQALAVCPPVLVQRL